MSDFSSEREQLLKGEVRLPDLVKRYLERIEEKNPEVNAFVSVDRQGAIEQAEAIQKRVDAGNAGSLAGAVVGIKDIICEKGKSVTCASRMLEGFESVYDATVIERLREEDAVLIGRLNMDEFAMGSSNENSIYGAAKNPHNGERVTGGSSGGSAAAIAAAMCNLTLGSDTGGSIRQPASYCGVVGLKPTYGRVSRHGLVAFASSFDCIGPLASTVRGTAALLGVVAGHDARDNTSSSESVPDYLAGMETEGTLRVGVPEEYFGEGLDREIHDTIRKLLEDLEANGRIELVPIRLPHTGYSIATYYILATAEASSNLARYDGVRYGHRAEMKEVHRELSLEKEAIETAVRKGGADALRAMAELDSPLIRLYKRSRTEGFGMEVKRRIILGTYVLSAGYYDAYYAKAQKVRRLIKEDFDNAFARVDVIVSPTAPTTAFELGSSLDDPVQMYLNDIYTTSANLAGICGISVPAGIASDGLPFGVQFMGDKFQEEMVLKAGSLVEQQLANTAS